MDKKIYDAMMEATDTPHFNNGGYYWPPEYVEKFALLLLRQAANAADMAREAECKYPGDYVIEFFGFDCTGRFEEN